MALLVLVVAATWILLQALLLAWKRCFHVSFLTVGWVTVSARTAVLNRTFSTYGRQYQEFLRHWFAMGVLVASMLAISSCLLLLQELWKAAALMDQLVTAPQERGAGLQGSPATPGLALAVPGITVPWGHAFYLWLAAAISISFHEVGHALAAASEGVGLHYVAAFVLFFLPGALVALDSDMLALLTPYRNLRVICAGVWHNVVLCMACWFIALLLPWLLWPLFSSGQGAVLRGVASDSPLAGHLAPLDMVTGINDCRVGSRAELVACLARGARPASPRSDATRPGTHPAPQPLSEDALLRLMAQPLGRAAGYCVPLQALSEAQTCTPDPLANSCGDNQLCFTEVSSTGSGGVGRRIHAEEGVVGRCLDARGALAHPACDLGAKPCPAKGRCVQPVLPQGDHLLKLCFQPGPNHKAVLRANTVQRRTARRSILEANLAAKGLLSTPSPTSTQNHTLAGDGAGNPLAGISGFGNPADFSGEARAFGRELVAKSGQESEVQRPGFEHRTLMSASDDGPLVKERGAADGELFCGDYVVFLGSQGALLRALDMTDYMPNFFFVPLWLPRLLEMLLAYTFSVSAAVALLNMAPVYFLDGEAALTALLSYGRASEVLPHAGTPKGRAATRGAARVDVLCHWLLRVGSAVFLLVLAAHAMRLFSLDVPIALALRRLRGAISFLFRGRD